MSRKEFIDSLREYLSYELPERLVSANVRKYEEYFEEQQKAGKRTSEIVKELGDPKLIARSCIDAAKCGKDGIPNSGDEPDFSEEIGREKTAGAGKGRGDESGRNGSAAGNTRIYTSRGCLIPVLILVALLVLLTVLFVSGIGFWIALGVLLISAVSYLIKFFSDK